MPAPKGEGKKGKSKKESLLQEQQRLVEEAHKAEEAELHRQATEERRVREEEAAKATALQATKNAETERLLHQARVDHRYIHRQQRLLQHLHSSIADQEEWEKYLQCNPLPDVSREAELNTYLSLWRDAPSASSTPHLLLSPLVLSCSVSESIVHSLAAAHALAREEVDLVAQARLSSFSSTLRCLIHAKLDALTSAYLTHSDQYLDAAHTLSLSSHSPHLDFALWVHGSAKHGRVKRIDWPDVGLSIELPVALQQSRIAIRAIRTTYDHVSTRDEDDSSTTASPPDAFDPSAPPATPRRPIASPHHFTSIGGMLSIEQLALPPPPKQAKGWAMRELVHSNPPLQPIPYPTEEAAPAPSAPSTAGGAGGQSNAPLRVAFNIPPSIYLPQALPHFGWYDTSTRAWRQDGVSLIAFDPQTRLTQLALSTLRPLALIQPRALDFPYRQWYLHTNGGQVELLLKGSRYDTTLAVHPGHCRLLHPQHPLLAPVNDAQLPPGRLLLRMQELGLNVMPSDDDGDYCRKPRKAAALLEALHAHIAGVVGVFDVGGMEMNGGRGERQAMFRVRLSRASALLQNSVERRERWQAERAASEWWQADREEAGAKVEEEVKEEPAPVDADDDEDDDTVSLPSDADAPPARGPDPPKPQVEPPRTPAEPAESKEARLEKAYQWHTVLCTLTDIDGTQVAPESPGVPLPYGTIAEWVPGGHELLRFGVVKGSTNGQVDVTPVGGQGVHVSLRRCLYGYWKGLMEGVEGVDLATAMDMSEEVEEEVRFLPVEEERLHHQQTVRKALNLTNPFRFF